MSNRQARFQDAEWFKVGHKDIVIGGAGGIGSWLAFFLARIAHRLYIYDDDTIDETNMAGQLYSTRQIGLNKAEAIAGTIRDFCEISPETHGRFTLESGLVSPIMFSCFDNMASRKVMFEKWAAQENREVFIDGRVLAEVGNVFVVQKGQEDLYRAELFDDSEVEEAPCSFKATSHCGAFIGSLMVTGLNNYLTNVYLNGDFRIIQFRTDFELPLMQMSEVIIKTEEYAST